MARPLTTIDLRIPHIHQETDLWCWAAVTQMITAHFKGLGQTPSQKEIVRMSLGQAPSAAWTQGIPNDGVVPNSDHFIRLIVKLLARRASDWYPPCTAEELYAYLYFGNPVILHMRLVDNLSHVVVVAGIRPTDVRGAFEVLLNDPARSIPSPFWAHYDAIYPAILQHMVVYKDINV